MENKDFDIIPEHSSRYREENLHPEVKAAYDFVNKVSNTSDVVSPQGGRAWHGWALREAFLAGCSYSAHSRPEPNPPTLKEISDWIISEQRLGAKWAKRVDHHDALPVACAAIHAFARYVPSSPLPVSVSERMPGEGDCDKEGRCWWLRVGTDGVGDWTQQSVCTLIQCNTYRLTHWLPAHALPLPGG
jgi:hypothetical protein